MIYDPAINLYLPSRYLFSEKKIAYFTMKNAHLGGGNGKFFKSYEFRRIFDFFLKTVSETQIVC